MDIQKSTWNKVCFIAFSGKLGTVVLVCFFHCVGLETSKVLLCNGRLNPKMIVSGMWLALLWKVIFINPRHMHSKGYGTVFVCAIIPYVYTTRWT